MSEPFDVLGGASALEVLPGVSVPDKGGVISSACHPQSPVEAFIKPNSKTIIIRCAVCEKFIAEAVITKS